VRKLFVAMCLDAVIRGQSLWLHTRIPRCSAWKIYPTFFAHTANSSLHRELKGKDDSSSYEN